jgi:hypothetical protein
MVTFTPPASNGGAPITSYTVTASPGGQTATGSGSPIFVGGLVNGQSYTFTVTATNAAGTGPSSLSSPPAVPAAGTRVPPPLPPPDQPRTPPPDPPEGDVRPPVPPH